MLELPENDLRRRALESDENPPILIACQIEVSDTETLYFNGSSGHSPTINSNVYIPNIVQKLKPPRLVSGAHRGIFEVTLVDINNTYYNKLVQNGYTHIPIQSGYFWYFENQWTDILWRYFGKITALTRGDDLLLIQAASFLASIDNYHTILATDRSQRNRNPSDPSLAEISTAKLHKFGGASRE